MKNHIYLCGGIFFALLLETISPKPPVSVGAFTRRKSTLNGECLSALLDVFTLGREKRVTIRADTVAKYKACTSNLPYYCWLTDTMKQNEFHQSVMEGVSGKALERMEQYAEKYLDASKYSTLIGYLLDIIEQDDEIADDDEFYIAGNQIPTTKKDLLQQTEVYDIPCLLGIFDYIVMHRIDTNCNGRFTYLEFFESDGAGKKYILKSGIKPQHIVKVNSFSLPTTVAPTTQPPQPAQQGDSQSPSCLLPPDKYFLIITTNRFADEFDTQTQSGGLMEYQIPAFNIDAKEFFAQKNPELLKAFETDPKGFLENLVGLPCIFSNYPEVGETIPDDGHYSPSPARMFDIGYLEKIGIEVGTYYTGKEVTTVLIEERRIEHTVRQCDIINHSTEFNFYHRKFIAPYKDGITLVECDLLGTLKELQLIP